MAQSLLVRRSAFSALSILMLTGGFGVFAACASIEATPISDEDGGLDAGNPDGKAPQVDAAAPEHIIKGTIVGLKGAGLVLRNNGANDLAIAATDTTFTFPAKVSVGGSYAVTVATQPKQPSQTCTVTKGAGTVSADVTDVVLTCVTSTFAVGGTITGLTGSGLVLQNNAGDDLTITPGDAGTATFTFPTKIESGQSFAVTVLTSPENPWQTCTLSGASGTIVAGDVSTVAVNCTVNGYTVAGTTSGLAGTGLTVSLKDDNGDTLATDAAINANGDFSFATPIPSGVHYNVAIASNPTTPWQTCTVGQGSGSIAGANVSNVTVACATDSFTVGGAVTGLAGSDLSISLKNDNGDTLAASLPISANGDFTFGSSIPSGTHYVVSVAQQPSNPSQTCTVSQGTGILAGANIANVSVACTTNSYTVGGAVSGIVGSGLVLQNNGGDDITIDADSPFTFASAIASNGAYNVTVKTQPTSSTCTVSNGSGTVTNANVTNVTVTCVTCGGYQSLGGCWYVSPSVGMTCDTVCNSHGGFDAVHAQHTGNSICTNFFPAKANGGNWVQTECCSTDNNTNWGANGQTPDPNWSHPACYVACACNN